MTCIVTLKTKDRIYMAADKRVSFATTASKIRYPKIIKTGGILLGFAGNGVLGHQALHVFRSPKYPTGLGPTNYVRAWIEAFNIYLVETGVVEDKYYRPVLHQDTDTSVVDTEFMMVVDGELFLIDLTIEGLQYFPHTFPYATGSGGDVALGSLLTTEVLDIDPVKRTRLAVSAASQIVSSCGNGCSILSLPYKGAQ